MAKITMVPSIDPAACGILDYATEMGIQTSFSRAADFKPCTIGNGQSGVCCKNCYMGPCRITKDGQVGICGATVETIAARNLARAIAAGSAAHSDHGRDLAFTLQAVGLGEAQGYEVRDEAKLYAVAAKHGIVGFTKAVPLETAPTGVTGILAVRALSRSPMSSRPVRTCCAAPLLARSSAVLEKMLADDLNVGGEQSGHMIFRDFATTGDGIVAALQVLRIMMDSDKRLSELRPAGIRTA